MGIPRQFDDIIKKHLNVNAAWLPITNNYLLGDYGIISAGVFTKMGNIQEFDVPINVENGPDANIDFTSADTTVVKFAGGVEVSTIPAGAVDTKITFKFNKKKSFMVKAPVIRVSQIQNVNQVAGKLSAVQNWGDNWKVVYQVYHAQDSVIVSTLAAGTELTFSGDAEALKNLNIGNASVELGFNKELGLKIQGKTGVIGLGLFKLKQTQPGPDFLSAKDQKAVEIEVLDNSAPQKNDL
jgi:hypothetical protein